jgi:hypothetical protein
MARTDPQDTWYVAKTSWANADPEFPDFLGGVRGRTRVRGSDPLYRKYPHLFEPLLSSDRSAPEVEAAVAGPGQKRGG